MIISLSFKNDIGSARMHAVQNTHKKYCFNFPLPSPSRLLSPSLQPDRWPGWPGSSYCPAPDGVYSAKWICAVESPECAQSKERMTYVKCTTKENKREFNSSIKHHRAPFRRFKLQISQNGWLYEGGTNTIDINAPNSTRGENLIFDRTFHVVPMFHFTRIITNYNNYQYIVLVFSLRWDRAGAYICHSFVAVRCREQSANTLRRSCNGSFLVRGKDGFDIDVPYVAQSNDPLVRHCCSLDLMYVRHFAITS